MDRILAITGVSSDERLQILGKLTLARQLHDTGQDLDRAYELLKGIQIADDMEDAFTLQRDRLTWLGSVCIMIGRFNEARSAFDRQLQMALDRGDRYLEANSRFHLARVAYEQLREAPQATAHRRAVALATEALAVATEAGHRGNEARAAWMLASLVPGEAGRRYLEQCLEAAESDDLVSLCLNPLAVRIAPTNPEQARRLIAKSLGLAGASGDPWAEVRVWQEGLRVSWSTEPESQAITASWKALDAIEDLRDRQPEGSDIQAGMFSIWSDDYAWLAGRLLEEGEGGQDSPRSVAEAFRVNERMRGRALSSWLRRTSTEAHGFGAARFRGLDEVQGALGPHEALLSFQVAPWEDLIGDFGGGSWVMVITRDGVHVHRLPGRVEVRRDVKIFEGLVEARNGSETRPAARLYEKLLAPALADLPASVTRLVLVPDDALHRLPFAALRASADAPPLGARFELVQVPSATLWLDWRREREAAPARPLLVLADPDVAAGEVPAETGGEPAVQVAQVRDAASGLGRLPHARAEARSAVRALGDGLLLMGPDASEAQVATLPLGDFGLVHFAAHAITDEDRPERSAVLLAPGSGDYDGRLESAEIAGLHLEGRTVVLASCRSASGSVLRGEGVMSLARAFFQAGAHGVVASLWPLRDDESAALFDRFYRHLANGESVAAALHGARVEAIEAGEPAAAWAGLVVLGDGSVVPVPGGRATSVWDHAGWVALWVLSALALAAGTVAGWRARR